MRHLFQKTALLLAFFSSSAMAECLDVYGVDEKESKQILAEYSPQLVKLTHALSTGVSHNSDNFFNSPEALKLREERKALIKKIKEERHYVYVDMDTIFYSEKECCTTLEIIKSNQQDRLRYVPEQRKIAYPKKHDIIDVMQTYQTLSRKLFFENKVQPTHLDCPVYHCTIGFSHPQLKPYLNKFNTAALQQRALILDVLKNDPDPTRRASAAYLVGHFRDPRDIVNVLMPYVNDKDDGVRNNVIRVLSLTTQKANITDLNPAPFIELLNSPFGTDRNKSLFLLSILAQSDVTKRYLIQHAKAPLLSILRLQQSNQHDFAYEILKQISHQDFGPHDEVRWSAWFDKQKNLDGRIS